jgi:hypothetical protein
MRSHCTSLKASTAILFTNTLTILMNGDFARLLVRYSNQSISKWHLKLSRSLQTILAIQMLHKKVLNRLIISIITTWSLNI